MASTRAVLFNPDLTDLIFEHLDYIDIGSLRLCSRNLNQSASPHLFRTLLVSTRKRHLRRLQRVAADGKFAKGVREIVLETVSYQTGYEFDHSFMLIMLTFNGAGLAEHRELASRSCIAVKRLKRLREDERSVSADTKEFVRFLVDSLKSLTGARAVRMTLWHGQGNGRSSLYDRAVLSCRSNQMPPPFSGTIIAAKSNAIKSMLLRQVLAAFLFSGHTLKHFAVESAFTGNLLGSHETQFSSSGEVLDLCSSVIGLPSGLLARPLRHLSSLSLKLRHTHLGLRPEEPHFAIEDMDLALFLGQLPELRKLDLDIRSSMYGCSDAAMVPLRKIFACTTFPLLQRLALTSPWLDAGELCAILKQHERSLETVTLTDVNLGQEDFELLQVPLHSLQLLPLDRVHPGWVQVSQTYQELPVLRGLKIEHPSSGSKRVAMSLCDAEELVENGMNGRENAFGEPDYDVWKSLGVGMDEE